MTDLAHGARDGYPEQSYQEHVDHVRRGAAENARAAARYAALDGHVLEEMTEAAACYHDLGKLDPANQQVLRERDAAYARLPVHHQDAGVAALKKYGAPALFAQLAVAAHHGGLPDLNLEITRGADNCFRDAQIKTRKRVDAQLDELARRHQRQIPEAGIRFSGMDARGDIGMFSRVLLSCLADADHSDTARHYGKFPQAWDAPPLRAGERLAQLDRYTAGLGDGSQRSRLRALMYQACRDCETKKNMVCCDSPVGSAKTTALMAHALRQAALRGARRVFVVLPFTNIISQSVRVYRQALTLPGEDAEAVVAELHHRADFESEDARALTAQWRAPIIVTTAVAFFETLASNAPATLRRLHQLPGSVIFVDEAHAALPVKLLPTAWHFMHVLANEWGCYWIFASGSLVEFWKLQEISTMQPCVPRIVEESLRKELMRYEAGRIKFRYRKEALSRAHLAQWVAGAPGPRLLILNTVQSAAAAAREMRNFYGKGQQNKVLHLSTALSAEDREKTIQTVKERLADKADTDWTLVATSCVEAGVDFSFKTGFRELASLLSLLQAAGRVNRGGADADAEIWSFTLRDDPLMTRNQGVEGAASILQRYFECNVSISPELSTQSLQKELARGVEVSQRLLCQEHAGQFPQVQREFRIIDEDTVLVVADPALKEQLRRGGCDWKAVQRKAVSIRKRRAQQLGLRPLADGIYDWARPYDGFLGIMKGILDDLEGRTQPLIL